MEDANTTPDEVVVESAVGNFLDRADEVLAKAATLADQVKLALDPVVAGYSVHEACLALTLVARRALNECEPPPSLHVLRDIRLATVRILETGSSSLEPASAELYRAHLEYIAHVLARAAVYAEAARKRATSSEE